MENSEPQTETESETSIETNESASSCHTIGDAPVVTAGNPRVPDFRSVLNLEFSRRVKVNPRYSLRAFAKSLGIYHATLSALLAGVRPFTPKSIRSLSEAMGASPRETHEYIEAFLRTREPRRPRTAHLPPENFLDLKLDLEEDAFALMSEWRHDAVLEALHLPKGRHDVKSLSALFSFSPAEVHSSLQMLSRCGLVETAAEGTFRAMDRNTTQILSPSQTSAARRAYQRSLLQKSAETVDVIPVERRDHSSMTMTVDEADLPELKALIKNFRRELTSFAQRKTANPDSVYQLQVSFFPLSEKKGEEI